MPRETPPPPQPDTPRTVLVPAMLLDALRLEGQSLSAESRDAYRELTLPWSTWIEDPVPGAEAWLCALRLSTQAGRAVISELRVFPREMWQGRERGTWSGEWKRDAPVPTGGIPARMLRRIPLGRMVAQELKRHAGGFALGDWLRDQRHEPTARRRRPPADAFLAYLAYRYYMLSLGEIRLPREEGADDPQAIGVTRHPKPVRALADELHVTPKEASQLVYRARARGFLSKTTQGKAGGALSDTVFVMLRDYIEEWRRQGQFPGRVNTDPSVRRRTDGGRDRLPEKEHRPDGERGATKRDAPAPARGGVRDRARVAPRRSIQRRRDQRRRV